MTVKSTTPKAAPTVKPAAEIKAAAAAPTVAEATTTAPAGDELTPATEMAASGAFIEPEIVAGIDVDHPAVDNNPRAGATAASNQIDFNDPTLSQSEAVARNLGANIEDASDDE